MARPKKKKPIAAKPVDTAPTQPKLEANKFPVVVKNTGGRPSDYNSYIAARICGKITDGQSLASICREDDMPGSSTVFEWLQAHTSFAEMYARAVENRTEMKAEEIIDIADDQDEDPQSRRVRIDARKFIAAKLLPRKYGDVLLTKHTGPRGTEPVQVQHTHVTIPAENLDPDSRETLRQTLLLVARGPAEEEQEDEDEETA